MSRKDGFRLPKDAGEDVVADIGGEHGDVPWRAWGVLRRVQDARAASLALFNQALLNQEGERLAYRLPAELIGFGQCHLCGELITGI